MALVTNLSELTKSEIELLAIASKTDLLTEEMLNNPDFANNGAAEFKSLVLKNFVSVEKKPAGFQISIDRKFSQTLQLEFLEIEQNRRLRICSFLADDLLKRGKVLESLQVLADCGDRRLFTDALLLNSIEIHSIDSANALLELCSMMLRQTSIDEMAFQSFCVTSYIWRGDYLLALKVLDTLDKDLQTGKLENHFESAVLLLRAYANMYMGRLITGHRNIESYMESLDRKPYIQDSAVILGCKLLAASALGSLDFEKSEKAYKVAAQRIEKLVSNSSYFEYQFIQIEAVKLFVEGRLNEAYEKAIAAIKISRENNYCEIQSPFESLYVKASCEEEFLEHLKAVNTWQELLDIADKLKFPGWYCVSYLRSKRAEYFLNPRIDLNESIQFVRDYYQSIPYRHELDIIVDIEELFIAYRLNNVNRARVLLNRIPNNSRTNEISMALELKDGKIPKLKKNINNTVREELMQLLVKANDPNISENQLRLNIENTLSIAEPNGWYRVICIQRPKYGSMVIRIAAEGRNAFREHIARLITEITEKKLGHSSSERLELTVREKEVLALLAAGYERSEICNQLSLSLNTLKTHQKNIYKKLEAPNRQLAVNNAKKLGLLSH